MIGDIDKADILTCSNELLRNFSPLLEWSVGSPASEIDDWNGCFVCSHDVDKGNELS